MDGRVGIVTGGAQGIGRGIADAMLKKGFRVAVLDLNNEALRQFADEAGSSGQFRPYLVDVTSSEQVCSAVAEITERWKAPDVLVNNAGNHRDKRIQNMSEEDWDVIINVNLRSRSCV
jgi:NAD(P)-dependent dehydrogenase (short-subunit alcohol dehydrogenase family)